MGEERDYCAYSDTRGCNGDVLWPESELRDGVCKKCLALDEADEDEAAHAYTKDCDSQEGRWP